MREESMNSIAPGMERIVVAGETLVIQDEAGQEFAVTGRDSEEVMQFLQEFDRWFTLVQKNITGAVLTAQWFAVKETFNNLPLRIQRELPSFAGGGVIVQPHSH